MDERADERTIDELITIATEMPDRLGLAAGLAELRGSARGEGVSVTVDVQGMLVDLDIDDRGIALGPQRLAAEISRLSAAASGTALRAGLRAVQAGSTPAIAAAIADSLGITDAADITDITDITDTADIVSGPVRDEPGTRGEGTASSAHGARPRRRAPVPDDDEPEGFVLVPE